MKVVFYRDNDGSVPLLEWLDRLPEKARDKCRVKLERLRELGHELRRPEVDYLRDGVYELRVGLRHVNYRILYFFHQAAVVVVSHGLTKDRAVPPGEIDRVIEHKLGFKVDPQRHTCEVI